MKLGFETNNVLRGESPVIGNSDQIEAVIIQFSKIQDELLNYIYVHRNIQSELSKLSSISVRKVSDFIENSLIQGSSRIENDLNIALRALQNYANEVVRIHRNAENALKESEAHLRTIRECVHQLEQHARNLGLLAAKVVPNYWNDRPSFVSPLPHPTATVIDIFHNSAILEAQIGWSACALKWHHAADQLEKYQNTWLILRDERVLAEQKLVQDVSSTLLGFILIRGRTPSRSQITASYTGTKVHPARNQQDSELTEILSGQLPPELVSIKWGQLASADKELNQFSAQTLLLVSNTSGIPFSVRHDATVKLLNYAQTKPRLAFYALGFQHNGMTFDDFQRNISGVQKSYDHAQKLAQKLPEKPTVQIFGLSNHDGAVTAAISLGDVDHASHVAVNVPGMNAEASNMTGILNAAGGLFESTAGVNVTPAIISWCGYNTPNYFEVLASHRAESGALELAKVIDSVNAVRSLESTSLINVSVLAHSYGSTTAVEALKLCSSRIDDLVIYGSAGLVTNDALRDAKATRFHATDASKDLVSDFGRHVSARSDPRNTQSVHIFTSEKTEKHNSVTVHDMYTDGKKERGYLTPGTSSQRYVSDVISSRF